MLEAEENEEESLEEVLEAAEILEDSLELDDELDEDELDEAELSELELKEEIELESE